ncbi:MAG TPA: MATE family efflux transporter [Bdellovibrio sp.]
MSQSKFVQESRALAFLSGPIIVGQVGQNLINLADTIMVGTLGPLALGASAFAASIYFIFLVFGIGVLSPVTALFARMQGQQNYPYGGVLLKHSLLIALGLSVFIIGILYILLQNLHHFGQTPEVLEMGRSFFQIIAWSVLPSMIYQAYKQFTDGIGNTKISMQVMIFAVIFNIGGNYILIHGLYGFPKLGLNGSAWATLIARSLMALIMIVYVHVHPRLKKYLQERWINPLDTHLLKNLVRLGLPNGMTYLFEVGAFSSAALMMGWFGAGPLAAHQISISLASMTFLVTTGVGIAASIRVGYELGCGDYASSRFAGFTAIKLGAIYMFACALGFFFLRHHLPKIYVTDIDVIDLAAQIFVIVAFFQIFDGIQAVAIGALRGMSDTQMPSLIAFFAYWIMGLPLGYMLAFHWGIGPVGIWMGLLIGLIFASTLLTWRFHILSKRHLSTL